MQGTFQERPKDAIHICTTLGLRLQWNIRKSKKRAAMEPGVLWEFFHAEMAEIL